MCGICGLVGQPGDSVAVGHALESMCRSMSDRGPDSSASWADGFAALGHTRLAIMDPGNQLANQPITGNNWVLSFNGEIYNFRALRSELESKGCRFKTDSDTEVLLQLLVEYGIDRTLEKITGIFAFCAYNTHAQIAYLVRDRLGIKPLFYWRDENTGILWFASTPAAIVNAQSRTWSLHRGSVYSFFHLGAPMSRSTFFDGIERLQPAEILEVDVKSNKTRSRYYWEPVFREGDIHRHVEEALLREKESHVPSAVFLSGGVDSSLMADILFDVEAFHLSSPEQEYAEYVAQKVNIELKIKQCLPDVDFDRLLEKYSRSSGETSASSPIPLMVSELIVDAGYKVAFSANGADELFFGYPRTPAPELRAENLPSVAYEDIPVTEESEQRYHIFRDENAIEIAGIDPSAYRGDIYQLYGIRKLGEGFPDSARYRWLELQTYVANDLNPTLDFSSMACSLEVRVPFLDYRLVEKCLSTDANELIKVDYGRKYPLKKMLKDRGFSPALWSRHKVGFSIPREVVASRRKKVRRHLAELRRLGLFSMGKSSGYAARDYQYLTSAAHAFDVWRRVWMDSGKVVI